MYDFLLNIFQYNVISNQISPGLLRDEPRPRLITTMIPIMPLERHLREILITMIIMPHHLGLLEIHTLLHLREGLLLIHMLLTRMQHHQQGATRRLLLPVRLPEIRIMMIPIMPPARMQHQRLLLLVLLLQLTPMPLTPMRDHLQLRQIHMQLLLEQTHMLAQIHTQDLKHQQPVLPTLELLLKIHMLRIHMPEIHIKGQLQIHTLLIHMRGRQQQQLPPRSVTLMLGLLLPQQIRTLEPRLPILMPALLHLIHTQDQLLQTLTLRFNLHSILR